jgi:hypothetical protein
MVRTILIMFGAIILIVLLRGSIGVIARGLRELINPDDKTLAKRQRPGTVQCPMCGSWVDPPVPPKD